MHAHSVAGLIEEPSVFSHEPIPSSHLHLVADEPTFSTDPLGSVAIVIVAYNAQYTIAAVLDRIPAPVAKYVGAILVSDDASSDRTAEVAQHWARNHPHVAVSVVQQPKNLGYGGNQKFCYRWAVARGLDHVVMIHGDGQYAPELVLSMAQPLLAGHAKVVFGSRMLAKGAARKGGCRATSGSATGC